MSGSYVAKPAAVVVPVIPPDWNPDWPFPGASPPGYTLDISLVTTSISSVAYDSGVHASAYLYDHDTYKTEQPPSDAKITWTATIDGFNRKLKLSGGSYSNSVQLDYVDLGAGFWGVATELFFDLTIGDIGKTIVLLATSLAFEKDVSGTSNIEVTDPSVTYTLSVDWTGSNATGKIIGAALGEYGYTIPACYYRFSFPTYEVPFYAYYTTINPYPTLVSITEAKPIVFGISDYGFYVSLKNAVPASDGVSILAIFNKYVGGILTETYTKTQTGIFPSNEITWLNILGGEITVINP